MLKRINAARVSTIAISALTTGILLGGLLLVVAHAYILAHH